MDKTKLDNFIKNNILILKFDEKNKEYDYNESIQLIEDKKKRKI